ncbi:hypothetical protein [Streptomyces avidinii]
MFSRGNRTSRRAAAALLAAVAVTGASAAVAGPASAADYGGNYGDAWVKNNGHGNYGKGYDKNYGDNYGNGYDGHYGDAWIPAGLRKADLKVTASGPATIAHDQEQRWVVEVTNAGRVDAASVKLSTTMPNGIRYVAHRASQGSTELTSDGRIVLSAGTVKPGATVRLEIAGRGPSHGGGTVQLRNQASTSTPETSTANNSAVVNTKIG